MLSKRKFICLIMIALVCVLIFSFCGCSAIKRKIDDFIDDLEVTDETIIVYDNNDNYFTDNNIGGD